MQSLKFFTTQQFSLFIFSFHVRMLATYGCVYKCVVKLEVFVEMKKNLLLALANHRIVIRMYAADHHLPKLKVLYLY